MLCDTYHLSRNAISAGPPAAIEQLTLGAEASIALESPDSDKILGLAGTLSCVALMCWIFPEYHGSFYDPYWTFLKILVPIIIVGAPFYISYIDHHLEIPEDELWQAKLFFTGAWTPIDWSQLRGFAFGWLIKAFFLPLMLVYLSQNLSIIVDWNRGFNHFLPVYDFLWTSLFAIDLLIACLSP